MTEQELKAIKVGILQLASASGKVLDRNSVDFYAKVIAMKLTFQEFEAAAIKWSLEKKNFPAPSELIQLIHPPVEEKDEAQIVVNKIIEAIKTHGYTWTQWVPKERYQGGSWEADAKAYLGELGFHVVKAWGGWGSIHESYFSAGEETVWRAQLRDFVQTQVCLLSTSRLDYLPDIPKPLRISDGQKGLPQRIDAAGLVASIGGPVSSK